MSKNDSEFKKPLVIFEMANNHMGDEKHAKKIINDFSKIIIPFKKKINFAIKFQYRDKENFIHKSYKNSDHKGVNRFETTFLKKKQWKSILSYARARFTLICTPFDEISVDNIIKDKFEYLKIASCSITDWPLIGYIKKKIKKKKIICSLGGATNKEISNITSFFSSPKFNVHYLYCVAQYPTQPNKMNLSFFNKLRNIYGDKIKGFSSHEMPGEFLSGGIAYSMGARIFEKHVGIKGTKYKINKYSATPSQFYKWLKYLDETILRCGSEISRAKNLKEERSQIFNFKRGAYIKDKQNVFKNNYLNKRNVCFQFPAVKGQLLANDFSKFSKFKAKKTINASEPILKKHLVINNKRNKIEFIREKIKELISRSNTTVPSLSKIEISHHYGIKNFDKFGLSMIQIYNKKYCKKLLFLLGKQTHPKQFHRQKDETFFILYGKIKLKTWKKNKKVSKILNPGNTYTVKPFEIHWFKSISESGAVVEELSTEHVIKDSFYIDDKINKNKNRKSWISLN